MGKLNDIRDKLLAGSTTKQLIEQGYAKSSVFQIDKKLRDTQNAKSRTSMSDEIQDLQHQRDVVKLKMEIEALEATRQNLPDRIATLEKSLIELRSLLYDAVDTAICVMLEHTGVDREEALKYSDDWVKKNLVDNPKIKK